LEDAPDHFALTASHFGLDARAWAGARGRDEFHFGALLAGRP